MIIDLETFTKLKKLYEVSKTIRAVRGGVPGDKLEMCGSKALELMFASDALDDFFLNAKE